MPTRISDNAISRYDAGLLAQAMTRSCGIKVLGM